MTNQTCTVSGCDKPRYSVSIFCARHIPVGVKYVAVLALALLSVACGTAQTTTIRLSGRTMDGTITGTLTASGPLSGMNLTAWDLVLDGAEFTPANSYYAGKVSGSFLMRPSNTVRAFYIRHADGRVVFLLIPDTFFADANPVGTVAHIYPFAVDVTNSVAAYGSGIYQSSYAPVVQVTSANIKITRIR